MTGCGSFPSGARPKHLRRSPTRSWPATWTLPHGFGTEYPDEDGEHKIHGVAVNELTDIEDRDWLSLTPHHKHVRVALEPVAG